MTITKTWREPGKRTFSMVIGGDFCPREQNSQYVAEHAAEIVAGVKSAFKQDAIKVLQWECAVTEGGTPIPKRGPNLRCNDKVLDIMSALDIDVALLANNHTGDYGPSEIGTTVEAISKRGIKTVGVGKDIEDAAKPLIMDKNGVRVAIINICENEFGGARRGKPGTNTMDPFVNIAQIKAARKQADVVVVTIHGGHEYNPYPSRRMIQLYRAFAEAGADAVWNCHTHCPEGFEVWGDTPIIYSPGNFFFPGWPHSKKTWWTGYITEFLCDENGVYGYEITPYGFTCEKMFLLEGETSVAAENYLMELCKPLSDMDQIDDLFDSWCTSAGIGYLNAVNTAVAETWPPDWTDEKVVYDWLGVRNIFTCESHAFLLQNTGRLIEEHRVAEAAAGFSRIAKLQDPDFVTW